MAAQTYWQSCQNCRGVKSLRNQITVQKIQNKISSGLDDTTHIRAYSDKGKIWADITTKSGVELVEGTNTIHVETHQFIMRYNQISKDIDKDYRIEYLGIIYVIDRITNVNEENKWIIIKAHVRGKDSVPRNI